MAVISTISMMDNVEYNNMTGADNTYIQNYTFFAESPFGELAAVGCSTAFLSKTATKTHKRSGLASIKLASQGFNIMLAYHGDSFTACAPAVRKPR